MDQTQRRLVVGLVVVAGGLLVTIAALERVTSPTLRALGEREQLIMAGLLITGVAVIIVGACEAAGFALLPNILPSAIVCLGAMFAGIDVFRIFMDSLRWLGAPAGPLAAVPSSSNWALFFGALFSFGGGLVMALARLGVFPSTKQSPDLSETKTGDLAKTYHANRWWMRHPSGSVLVWDDQAQAWSPWVHGRDPGLPPGWS